MKLYKRQGSDKWYLSYKLDGRLIRESTNCADMAGAQAFLDHRRDELGAARLGLKAFVGPLAERVVVAEILDELSESFKVRNIKSLRKTLAHLKLTRQDFGHLRLKQVTPAYMDSWLRSKLRAKEPLSPATLNRRIQILRQGLQLAVDRGYLASVPHLAKLSEVGRERRGFLEHAEYLAIMGQLPAYLRDMTAFAYLTGWRLGELKSLRWRDVDITEGVIRLRAENAKIGRGRSMVIDGQVKAIIESAAKARAIQTQDGHIISEFVFHYQGRAIANFYRQWRKARKAAGCPGKIFHDLRRTAARNMRRAGVTENVAMSVTGHRTRSMFDRCNIVSSEDQRTALAKVSENLAQEPTESNVLKMKKAQF